MRLTSKLLSILILGVFFVGCSESESPAPKEDKQASTAVTEESGVSAKPKVVGYFPAWEPERGYRVKDIVTRGAAEQLTHILFAFGGVVDGKCALDRVPATIEHAYSAEDSVDGIADAEDAKVKGAIGQLLKLKKMYPDLKLLWSIGGWTLSTGFIDAAKDVETFADSCYDMIHDPRWDGLFDGIDIDWEYPNACGIECDKSGRDGYYKLMKAVRERFGNDELVTTAIGAQLKTLTAADYAKAEPYIDFFMPMTYDYSGGWAPQGPTYPHSPLFRVPGTEGTDEEKNSTDDSIRYMLEQGIPAEKILLGIGFYGRGWTGVSQPEALGSASAPAPGKHELGADSYNILKTRCPASGVVGGTAYGFCDGEWWSYDTPKTVLGKMDYAKQKGLGGAFFWQLSGDDEEGALLGAIVEGLK